MPRTCTICDSEHRRDIDRDLVHGRGLRTIANTYSVGEYSVRRHRQDHLPALLAKAYDAEEGERAGDLLADMRDLQARTLAILEATEVTNEHRTALAAIAEARRNLELIGEVTKELDRTPTLNLSLNAEWIEIRTAILHALEPYSAARESVLRAIAGSSNGRA